MSTAQKIREEGIKQGIEQGRAQGREQGRAQVALAMSAAGCGLELISSVTRVSPEKLKVMLGNLCT